MFAKSNRPEDERSPLIQRARSSKRTKYTFALIALSIAIAVLSATPVAHRGSKLGFIDWIMNRINGLTAITPIYENNGRVDELDFAAAYLSQAVYSNKDEHEANLAGLQDAAQYLGTEFDFSKDVTVLNGPAISEWSQTGVSWVVKDPSHKRLFLVFKGSSTASDFIQVLRNGERACLENGAYAPKIDESQIEEFEKTVGWLPSKCTCFAQLGFYTQYKSLAEAALMSSHKVAENEIVNFIAHQFNSKYDDGKSLAVYIKSLIEDGKIGFDVKEVVITGHSLGGAIADLAYFDFKIRQHGGKFPKNVVLKHRSFGANRALTHGCIGQLYATESTSVVDSKRFAGNSDPAPNLGDKFSGFTHFGSSYFLTGAQCGGDVIWKCKQEKAEKVWTKKQVCHLWCHDVWWWFDGGVEKDEFGRTKCETFQYAQWLIDTGIQAETAECQIWDDSGSDHKACEPDANKLHCELKSYGLKPDEMKSLAPVDRLKQESELPKDFDKLSLMAFEDHYMSIYIARMNALPQQSTTPRPKGKGACRRTLTVTRKDSNGSWGMPLAFKCGTETIVVGDSSANSKQIITQVAITADACPSRVDKSNWLGDHQYGDFFDVVTSGSCSSIT